MPKQPNTVKLMKMKDRSRLQGVSLLEILISFSILLIAVLTLVGYTTTIHRAAKESKRQALASMEARALMERIRDHSPFFELAVDPGYTETRTEYLLDTESDAQDNEAGQQSATVFQMEAKATPITDDIYSLVVTTTWEEDGRTRRVVLESRMERPFF